MQSRSLKSCYHAIKRIYLLVDEIHLKPYFDYKGGNIAGAAYNSEQPANSAFVFMDTSLFLSLKDVVYIIPSTKMKSEVLYRLILKTITGLETIGFRVISVSTDNNAINSKAMSLFSSPPKKIYCLSTSQRQFSSSVFYFGFCPHFKMHKK